MEKAQVLIVEDDPNVASFLEKTLSSSYSITIANDGSQAMDLLKDLKPHLMILDVRLPVISGVELYLRIKEDERFVDMRVLAITGFPDHPETIRMKQSGVDMILEKPITPRRIRKAVEKLLKNTP